MAPTRRLAALARVILATLSVITLTSILLPSTRGVIYDQTWPPSSAKEAPTFIGARGSYNETQAQYCENRFDSAYLRNYLPSQTSYCDPADAGSDSQSEIWCCHNQIAEDKRVDSFCITSPAIFDPEHSSFHLPCELRDMTSDEVTRGVPDFLHLSEYWYGTGPKNIIQSQIRLWMPSESRQGRSYFTPHDRSRKDPTYLMLVKREGCCNLWHSMLEIFAALTTLDILALSPLASKKQLSNVQVVISDEHADGAFFRLWTLVAPAHPVIRISDLASPLLSNRRVALILPLAGGSSPFWLGDWSLHNCGPSMVVQDLATRILKFHGIQSSSQPKPDRPSVTIIQRSRSRKLASVGTLVADLEFHFLNEAFIQVVDLADATFEKQLRIIQGTDVLVGVHGAGLTHGMFLRPGSAVVEIMPSQVNFKGFENLAEQTGVRYHRVNGTDAGGPEKVKPGWRNLKEAGDWHLKDVAVDHRDLIRAVDKAVASIGPRQG